MRGPVATGYGRGGKKLGVPTANLPGPQFRDALAPVPAGVYFGWAAVDGGAPVPAVVNVGYSPTFVGVGPTLPPLPPALPPALPPPPALPLPLPLPLPPLTLSSLPPSLALSLRPPAPPLTHARIFVHVALPMPSWRH